MRLPKPLLYPFLYVPVYVVPLVWCACSIGWLIAAWFGTDHVSIMISGYTAGICGATAFYHCLVMRLFKVNRRLAETIEYQQEALQTLMTMKASEVSDAIAEQLQGIINVDSPTITRH